MLPLGAIQRLAAKVASRYSSRSWASGDARRDVEQEATAAMVEALPRWEPEWRELEAYLWNAGVRAALRYIRRNCAPVTGRSAKAERELYALRGTSLTPAGAYVDGEREVMLPALGATPERHVARANHCAQVAERVRSVLGKDGAIFITAIATRAWTPAQIATAHAIPVEAVYAASSACRRALRADEKLHELWEEWDE